MKSTSVSSKKRKAPSTQTAAKQSASSPQKTVAVSVEVAPINPEHDPIVVSFPRGVPASIAAGDSDGMASNPPPRFTCTNIKESSSRGRRISGEDDDCTYTALAQGRGHDGRLTKIFVGIYNKKSKTLKLVPAAEKGTVFALDQKVKGYTPNVANGSLLFGGTQTQSNGDGSAAQATGGVISAANQVQMLVESFGSRKKQKVMASRASNKVNIHSVVGSGDAMMKSVTKQEGISAENKMKIEEGGGATMNPNDIAYEQARLKLLPPYDIDANTPSKVYNAQVIAGDTAWTQLSRIVEKVIKTNEGEFNPDWTDALLGKKSHRPQSISTLLSNINPTKKKGGGGGGANYRIKVAFFLFCTLKFHSRIQRRNGVIEGATLDDCITELYVPHEVGARLMELFTSEIDGPKHNGYIASKQQKSKLTAYILILYVIASGNEMKVWSINQLCKDMKLDEKEAMLVLREAGFTVKKSGGGDIGISLSVPLTFPAPKRGKRT